MSTFKSALLAVITPVSVGVPCLHAQGSEPGWGIYQQVQGSSGDYGNILKLDTGVTYSFNRRVAVGFGVPHYVVKDTTVAGSSFDSGIGNAYLTLEFNGPAEASSASPVLRVGFRRS